MKKGKVIIFENMLTTDAVKNTIITDVYKCEYGVFSKTLKVYQSYGGLKSEEVICGVMIKSVRAEGIHIQLKGV